MKKQINHISVFQSSKTISVLFGLVGVIIAYPLALFAFLNGLPKDGLQLIILPFIWIVMGFIFYAIFFALYNFIARFFGGIEVEFKDVE